MSSGAAQLHREHRSTFLHFLSVIITPRHIVTLLTTVKCIQISYCLQNLIDKLWIWIFELGREEKSDTTVLLRNIEEYKPQKHRPQLLRLFSF